MNSATNKIPELEAEVLPLAFAYIYWKTYAVYWFTLGYDEETFKRKYAEDDETVRYYCRQLHHNFVLSDILDA